MLRLTTFGGVGIRAGGADGTPATELAVSRRALALLVLVAAAPRTGISRDKVVALLWPESDEEHGRNALRQSLHTLRRELRAPEVLQGSDVLRLDPAALASDLREFETARTAGRPEDAAGLYAGPFLDGFHVGGSPEFERWVEETRAAYKREFADLVQGLAREAGRKGDQAGAVRWWRRLAVEDPLDSAVALGLMEALAAAGDRAGALRHGQVHETLLREELGAGPDPSIRRLMERLRAGPGPEAPAAPLARPPVGGVAPAGVSRPAAPPALKFLADLRAALEGRYAIEEEVERSREGAVRLLRARDVRHDREVVLKVLHPSLASMLDVDRFLREIKLTARLRHPHILPLLDSGEVNGRPWFAMPEIGGVSLRARLTAEGRIPQNEVIAIAQELAGALDHAHRHGVLHRDVSPENVLLAEGHALLTNLGVARALDAAATPKLTETGMLVGSPAYVSPEQAADTGPLDGRSDQYSLACVVYEMLSGEPLFSGPTPQAIMAKRAAHRPGALGRSGVIPTEMAAVLERALAAQPERRFSKVGELATALAMGTARPGRERRWLRWLRPR
jgi:DNA-binding SARP family transcriptional activator